MINSERFWVLGFWALYVLVLLKMQKATQEKDVIDQVLRTHQAVEWVPNWAFLSIC